MLKIIFNCKRRKPRHRRVGLEKDKVIKIVGEVWTITTIIIYLLGQQLSIYLCINGTIMYPSIYLLSVQLPKNLSPQAEAKLLCNPSQIKRFIEIFLSRYIDTHSIISLVLSLKIQDNYIKR